MKTRFVNFIQPLKPDRAQLGDNLQWYINQTESPALYWYLVANPITSEELEIRRCKSDILMIPLIPYKQQLEMKPLEFLITSAFIGVKKIEDQVPSNVIDWMNVYGCIDEEDERIWLGFSFLVKDPSS